jgi:hypothetical protein
MTEPINPSFWQPWPGPTGTTGPEFLGPTGAVTGPAFFGVTGATGPTGLQQQPAHVKYLYDRARSELIGSSDAMVRNIMYDMFLEWFKDTTMWMEAIPGLLQPSTMLYYIMTGNPQSLGDPFPAGIIDKLVSVIDPNTFPWNADMPAPPVLRIQYPPNQPQTVWVTVIKNVARPEPGDLPDVPQWVCDRYSEYLLAGVMGKMMLQLNRPYSDAKEGTRRYQFFRQGVTMGKVATLRNNTWGTQKWSFPDFFRTKSQHGWVVTIGSGQRW